MEINIQLTLISQQCRRSSLQQSHRVQSRKHHSYECRLLGRHTELPAVQQQHNHCHRLRFNRLEERSLPMLCLSLYYRLPFEMVQRAPVATNKSGLVLFLFFKKRRLSLKAGPDLSLYIESCHDTQDYYYFLSHLLTFAKLLLPKCLFVVHRSYRSKRLVLHQRS